MNMKTYNLSCEILHTGPSQMLRLDHHKVNDKALKCYATFAKEMDH